MEQARTVWVWPAHGDHRFRSTAFPVLADLSRLTFPSHSGCHLADIPLPQQPFQVRAWVTCRAPAFCLKGGSVWTAVATLSRSALPATAALYPAAFPVHALSRARPIGIRTYGLKRSVPCCRARSTRRHSRSSLVPTSYAISGHPSQSRDRARLVLRGAHSHMWWTKETRLAG